VSFKETHLIRSGGPVKLVAGSKSHAGMRAAPGVTWAILGPFLKRVRKGEF